MGIGKSRAKVSDEDEPTTRFADIAGYEGSTAEVMEVVDFLKHADRYARAGAVGPKGVLMVVPPGTGRTLLARAVAGEAGVRLVALSGSSLVEMFVGVGASRGRSLFTDARKRSPSIIFIDEIDAIGGRRGPGGSGSNDEREQTVNQLLSDMDGFEPGANVVVIAATNRAEILDAALLRPGRFDRMVEIPPPEPAGAHGDPGHPRKGQDPGRRRRPRCRARHHHRGRLRRRPGPPADRAPGLLQRAPAA
jgi:cell division protease FtsH